MGRPSRTSAPKPSARSSPSSDSRVAAEKHCTMESREKNLQLTCSLASYTTRNYKSRNEGRSGSHLDRTSRRGPSHGPCNRGRNSEGNTEHTLHAIISNRAPKAISRGGTGCRHLRRGRSSHRLRSNGWPTRNSRATAKVQDMREHSLRVSRPFWTHRTV